MAERGKGSSPTGQTGPASAAGSSPGGPPPIPSSSAVSGTVPSAAAVSVDPLIGRVVNGRFKVVSLIARGGMGRVYRAEQAPLGRVCALKILTTTYEGEHDPEFHKRFFLEASIASKITHPNSVTIFDYGQTEDDIYYMAMEFLEGVTLHRAIRLAGFFPEARVAHIGRQVCRALREAHALGCIHRDLKPANIFLTEHGDEPDFVKVLDFGLVKNVLGDGKPEEQLTQTGLFMGSPKYMAPEQIRGERVDIRTDVYSLGIIMYEMLTGKVPFERLTSLNTLMAQVNDKPPPLRETNPAVDVSPELEDLVLRCMAKDPNERVSSMDEVLATLKRIVAPGFGLTGEYRALGASASGAFTRAEGTPSSSMLPARAPLSGAGRPSARPAGGPADGGTDQPSVSVSLSSVPLTRPSVTPMIESAGGGSVTVAPGSMPPPDFRRGGGKNVGLILVGVGLIGLVAVLALRSQPQGAATKDPSPPAATAVAALPPSTAATPPATASASSPLTTTLSVHFVSDPPGASVKEGTEEICAATPCDHGFAADMSAEHKVVIARSGFRSETRTVHGTDSQVAVTLVPAKAWTPPSAGKAASKGSGNSAGAAKDGNGAAPQGFKDIPY
jgi:serine/threonine protein kinase